MCSRLARDVYGRLVVVDTSTGEPTVFRVLGNAVRVAATGIYFAEEEARPAREHNELRRNGGARRRTGEPCVNRVPIAASESVSDAS